MPDLKIRTTVDIAAPAAEAWRLFGERFADWADWAPGIDRSTFEGPLAQGVLRVNQTASLGTVRQELVRFDPGARALAYEVRSGLPPVFTHLRNDWAIEALGPDRCQPDPARLHALLALPFDHVLPANGDPVIGQARERYRPAVEAYAGRS